MLSYTVPSALSTGLPDCSTETLELMDMLHPFDTSTPLSATQAPLDFETSQDIVSRLDYVHIFSSSYQKTVEGSTLKENNIEFSVEYLP